MKRFIRMLVLAVVLLAGINTVSAQTVTVQMTQKVAVLPVTVTSYLDDPLRYFNVQFFVDGAGSDGLDIFFDLDFTLEGSDFYVRTTEGTTPMAPIHLYEGPNNMKSNVLWTQVANRTETNVKYDNPLDYQQLPEGTYHLCITMYRWSDRFVSRDNPLCRYCLDFIICYSGSAPELVSPMAGAEMALNGALVVTPNRKLHFFWTPVISNCAGRNARFNYYLKVVKVLRGQNYNDAIKYNPTVFSAEVRNSNFAVFDTLIDIKAQLERGELYVAQVQAEQIKNRDSEVTFVVANDGNSQPLPFFWGNGGHSDGYVPDIYYPNENLEGTTETPAGRAKRTYGYTVDDESEEGEESEGVEGMTLWAGGVEEVSELGTIVDEMKEQYLAGFIQDATTIASLTQAYPEEWKYVPVPKRRYVQSDGYYTVPVSSDLEVSFMPMRHKALKDFSYVVEVYDYMDGGVDSITAYMPLFSDTIREVPDDYSKMDSHELVTRTLEGWGDGLVEGNLYYLQLASTFTAGYWDYEIADTLFYVNEMLAEHVHDTVSREFTEQQLSYANGVFFQWGDDPEVPGYTTPQWKAPVDRTGDDIYDPANYSVPATVPEMKKAKAFPLAWAPVKKQAEEDEVTYEVNVYELKSGQTVDQAIASNKALVTRTVTDANEIAETDTDFFKVFAPKKTYVLTLATNVESETNVYHFENGNNAIPVVFKVVK